MAVAHAMRRNFRPKKVGRGISTSAVGIKKVGGAISTSLILIRQPSKAKANASSQTLAKGADNG
jgi:hypothetical protein